jgi:hypothetical protein
MKPYSFLTIICSLIGHKISLLDECRLFNRTEQTLEIKCSRCNFELILTKEPLYKNIYKVKEKYWA